MLVSIGSSAGKYARDGCLLGQLYTEAENKAAESKENGDVVEKAIEKVARLAAYREIADGASSWTVDAIGIEQHCTLNLGLLWLL